VNSGFIVSAIRKCLLLISILVALSSNTIIACPQSEGNPLAIIPPFLDRRHRNDWESTLQLARQEFVVFLYRDAAVIYSEADFVNTGSDTLRTELGLPSTGFSCDEESGGQDVSIGIRDVRLWLARERIEPVLHHDAEVDWLTVTAVFTPQVQTTVRALFWVETPTGADSVDRAIGIPVSKAAIWKDIINSVDATVILKEGITTDDSLFEADPDSYSVEDSVLTWSFRNIEPSQSDDISILYDSPQPRIIDPGMTENLSRFIIEHVYDEMLEYVRESEEE
jgi:hypothetical protein